MTKKSHPLFDFYDDMMGRMYPPQGTVHPDAENAQEDAATGEENDAAAQQQTVEQVAQKVRGEAQQDALMVGSLLEAMLVNRRRRGP